MDFSKAYHNLNRERVWEKMEKFDVPRKVINLANPKVRGYLNAVRPDGDISKNLQQE